MDKEKQIEEIASIIKSVKYEPFNYGKPTYTVGNQMQDFVFDLIAEELLKQNYRKINENEVVISKERYVELNRRLTPSESKRQKDIAVEMARKETAREILSKIKEVKTQDCGYTDWLDDTFFGEEYKKLAEKYGVD